jgi:nucleoside-diphosphate-sugar epimerase
LKIFITGATGYIGQKLALEALERGYAVSLLVRSASSLRLSKSPLLSVYEGDLTKPSTLQIAMQHCDAVLHAAGVTQFWHKDPSIFYRVNVEGTRNVLEAAAQKGISRVVFTSSCAVLGPSDDQPVKEGDTRKAPFENHYEISKHRAEELVSEYAGNGLHAVTVRPPRVFGPGLLTKGNPVNKLIRVTLNRGYAFMPSAKKVIGNYAFIDDVVNGHFLALEKGRKGEAYNLGGENVSYERLFATIASEGERKIRIIPVPVPFLKAWATVVFGLNYLVGRHTHVSPQVINRLVQNRAVSCEKAVTELGYTITPFNRAIALTIRHIREQ